MQSPYEAVMKAITYGGGGLLVCMWLALIWLGPTEPPEWLVKGLFLLIALPTFIYTAIVLSSWVTYFRERREQ